MKQAEKHLELEQMKFETFMENASAGVMLINEKGIITASNPLAAELFGYMPGALKNKPMEILLPLNIRYKHKSYENDFFMEASLKLRQQSKDVTGLRKDGSMFPLEVKLGTYKYGKEVFVMAFLTDISERKESEQAIRSLNLELEQKIRDRTEALASTVVKLEQQITETEEAEKELELMLAKEKHLNELKSRFVSIASHEFKTPLSTILSSAYLIQMYTQAEEQVKRNKHIERIVHSVNNLTSILNEFLNVGKLEEGKLMVNPQEIDLESHIKEMMNDCASLLKAGQEIDYIHNGPTNFFTDITLIRHIILNLLTNAIKFSPSDKKVHLWTKIENDRLYVTVRDEGMGIPEEDKKHLFERFFRGSNAMTVQGTGLGLHIVGRYTEMLGGEINCTSQLGKGTSFNLEIPSVSPS
jgi:PAS domain S-box-containing protein